MTDLAQPRLVILETSGRSGQVALAEGDMIRAVRALDEARRQARDLAPAVAELLAGLGWRPRDLHGILISRGPGSYTGLRVGVMSAKTLAYATGCALIAVDTFAAIALQTPAEARRLAVLEDAQQNKVYVQHFVRSQPGAAWQPATPLSVQNLADWLAALERDRWVTGPGLRVAGKRLPEGTPIVDVGQWDPRPESLLRLGLARYRAGQRDDVWALEPLYLRPSSAEEKWQERHGG